MPTGSVFLDKEFLRACGVGRYDMLLWIHLSELLDGGHGERFSGGRNSSEPGGKVGHIEDGKVGHIEDGSGVSDWIWRAPWNQSDFSESVAFESPGTHPPSYDMIPILCIHGDAAKDHKIERNRPANITAGSGQRTPEPCKYRVPVDSYIREDVKDLKNIQACHDR